MDNKPINRTNIIHHLIEYELQMVGKTMVDTIDSDNWHFEWTMTQKQYTEFHKYAVSVMKKVFKVPPKKAKENFPWFWENFGLRIKN